MLILNIDVTELQTQNIAPQLTSMCCVVVTTLVFQAGSQGSSLGRTSTQSLKIIEEKGLPLH